MKKTTILSLATAAAFITTTIGTYAAWDRTEVTTNTESVTFRNPVTVDVGALSLSTDSTIGTTPSATGSVTFTVEGDDQVDTLTLTPVIAGGEGVDVNDFDITITDKSEALTPALAGDATAGFKDTSLKTTVYDITITPKEASASQVTSQAVTVQLKAVLSKSVQ